MVDILLNYFSLILTFLAVGLGYLSLLLGYTFAGKTKEFFKGEKLKATDKMTLSFIIGAFSLIALINVYDIRLESIENNVLNIIVYDLAMIIGFSIFISYLLKKYRY